MEDAPVEQMLTGAKFAKLCNQSINIYFFQLPKVQNLCAKKSKLCKIVVEMCNVVKIGKNMQSMQTIFFANIASKKKTCHKIKGAKKKNKK